MVKIIDRGLAKANSPLLKGNTTTITSIRFTKKRKGKNENLRSK